MLKKPKIINGFCYLDGDEVIFVSLYNERKTEHDKDLFEKFIKEFKITEEHIILANKEQGITPLYTILLKKGVPIKDIEYESLIDKVFKLCSDAIKTHSH